MKSGRASASPPQRLAFSKRGMVSTAQDLATRAGVEMLEAGGNAVDAAVASAFALGVVEPQASGLGGQTMMLIHLVDPRRTFALDGSSRAPNRAVPKLLSRKETLRGLRATTVPSTPATLAYALRTYGTLPLDRVIEPAMRYAHDGFAVTELFHTLSVRERKNLKKGTAGSVFLKNGRTLRAGDELRQPALARTLQRIGSVGVEDFYLGEIAGKIHAQMEANDGLLHQDDLAQIPWPIERRPVSTKFQGMRIVTFPPPGAGRVLVEMLNIIQSFPSTLWTPDTPKGAHLLAEIMRQGALERNDRPFDPQFFSQVEERLMLDRGHAESLAKKINRRLRTHGETTHLSVTDGAGNAVALTQSIERVFGSFELHPELGFLYNDYMSAYEYEDMSHPYYLRPNSPPWASVAPTIGFRGQRASLVIGSPGSERIVTSILQVLLRLLRSAPDDAVAAPRLHCSEAGKVSLEASRFRDDIPPYLEKRGFTIDAREPFAFYLGCVQLILRDRSGFIGVADPRRDGSSRGPR